MEQNPLSNNVIVDWLEDYTHFICDRFGIPHNQAHGLLQQYLNLTARGSLQQPDTSLFEQPKSYPEPSNPHHEALFREQSLNTHFATHLQNQSLSYSVPSSPRHEAHIGEVADDSSNSMALTAPSATTQGQVSSFDEQSGNMMTTDLDFSETGSPSPQSTQPFNNTRIGSISEYDPLWVQHDNVDPAIVEGFRSAMKFETLFYASVIKIGDVLTFQVSVFDNGQALATEAYLLIISSSRHPNTKGRRFPDLSITLLSDPSKQYPIAKACQGTTAMIDHLQTCNITVPKSGWRDIQVIRGQQALGSLWWVKQAFHLWRDKKDREAAETRQYFRRRRAQGKGKEGVKQFKGVFGVWQHGVFVPDQDQARFRGRG